MKPTYQTAVATLIQFITLSLLGIANALNSIIATCRHQGSECVSNLVPSILFFILTAAWFGIIWVLGYSAQERRSKRLALALIGAEFLVALVAYFNAKHHTDLLSLGTSLVDLLMAFWVIALAFRLVRSGGGRITTRQRPRQRKKPSPN
jgi:hypothetical protein